MLSHNGSWQGTLGRMGVRLVTHLALVVLALALAGSLTVGMAPGASAAGKSATSATSCGAATSAKPGCGPSECGPITAKDYLLPATKPRGGAQATLSRTSGVGGSLDTLSGTHWPAGATVELLLGSSDTYGDFGIIPTPFAQGVADASGHLAITNFQTPDVEQCMAPDNQHAGNNEKLFIAQTADGQARVSLLYTFFPNPTLELGVATDTSWIVSGGDQIFVTGSGWEPGQIVTITPAVARWPRIGYLETDATDFQRLPLEARSARAIYNGSLATYVTIPPEPPETQVVFFATASGPRNGDVTIELSELFSVRPQGQATLAIEQHSGVAGSTVTVTGTNWPIGQTVLIAYCRGQDTPRCLEGTTAGLASVSADNSGRFTTAVTIPDDARAGPITLQASLLSSPFSGDGDTIYHQSQPFMIVYPFAVAHPRLMMAINASPLAAAGLVIGLLALGEWIRKRRAARV